MEIASPLSMLDRMRPENVAQRATRVLSSGVAAASGQLHETVAEAAAARQPHPSSAPAPRFGDLAARDSRARPQRSHASDTGPRPEAHRPAPPARPEAGAAATVRPAARLSVPDRAPSSSAAPISRAEMVFSAGLDGLDLLATTQATRLASGLARAAYAVLRPLV